MNITTGIALVNAGLPEMCGELEMLRVQRNELEAELAASKQRTQELEDAITEAGIALCCEGPVTISNKAAMNILATVMKNPELPKRQGI